ncbi:MAG: LuxR C-terminal-related transcriptional regulator [Prolixibacteraceae bacterium]|nr:LuxR C-terminal-related transcriptional regulator [Prolixibacteraceae bacterium]
MNSNQNISVVVISQSDLVLTGLFEVLKGSLASEVVLLHRGDELVDYQAMNGSVLILATSEEQEKSSSLMRQILVSAQQIHFMTLHLEADSVYSNQTINLFDAPTLICYKVNEILNSFLSDQNKDTDTELTKREIEVLQMVTKGHSNKEIADRLFVSTHTVISHRKNISEKTGIKSASGLTMYAILKKIIDMNEIDTADLI